MAPPRLELFHPEEIQFHPTEIIVTQKAVEESLPKYEIAEKLLEKKSPFAPNKPAAPRTSEEAKVIRRKKVLALWNSGEHDTWKIADIIGSTRGAVYNDLRMLGIKKK